MKIRYGCAPINWSNDDLPSLGGDLTYQQCLSEMALAGFEASEGGIKYPKDYATLKKALDLRNLTICNMWFSSFFTSFENEKTCEAFERHIDYTHSLGARVVGVGECGVTIHGDPSIPLFSKRPILDSKQFENLANGLNQLGEKAKQKGMKLCFHPHVGTGIQSMSEIDRLMESTNPELVWLLFDTGHSVVAQQDPAKILEKHGHRVAHVHLKDVRGEVFKQALEQDWSFLQGVQSGLFTVPGDGTEVDWTQIFNLLNALDYDGWVVVEAEQDPAKADPLEYAIKARKFMKSIVGY